MHRTPARSVTTVLIALSLSLPSCRRSRSSEQAPGPAADSLTAARQMTEMQRWVDSAATAMGIEARRDTATRRTVTSAGELADTIAGEHVAVVFSCRGGDGITARVRGDSATLTLPGRTVALGRRPAPTGSTYAGGGYTFRSDGRSATLDDPGGISTECARARATSP